MMMLSPRRGILALIFAVLAVAGAVLLVSCSGDDDDNGGGAGADAQGVLQAIQFLDGAGLHGIDDAINEDGEIPADARTVALKAETVTRLTEWPSELESSAEALAQIFADMAAALDGDSPDMAAAGEAAANAHDAEHDFSHDVWEYLYGEAGVEGSSGGH